jgi:WD40 repeat protein
VACVASRIPAGPSPFDRLRREDIPADKLAKAGNGDREKAPKELVAILGPGIYSKKLSPDGKTLALAYQLGKPPGRVTNKLTLWDVGTGAESLLAPVTATGMVFSHDSKLLALSHNMAHSYNTGGAVWDLDRRKELQVLSRVPYREVCFAFTPDDRAIFFCSPERDPKTDKGDRLSMQPVQGRNPGPALPRVSFEQGDVSPHILALSPDGAALAAGVGNTLKMWDARAGQLLLGTVAPARRAIHDMAFSPDGKLLTFVEAYNANVEVLEVATRKPLRTFVQEKGTTVSVTFHPDGALAASCGKDGVVRLWNPRTGIQTRVLHLNPPAGGPESTFWRLQFAPDGRHLLANYPTGLVYILRLAPPAAPQDR